MTAPTVTKEPAKEPARRFAGLRIASVLGVVLVVAGLLWDGSPLAGFLVRAASRVRSPGLRRVGPEELAVWMADSNRPPPIVVDMRPPQLYFVSHIPGAVQVDPDSLELSGVGKSAKDAPLVVYDGPGLRGAGMIQVLRAAGFTRVSQLEGGLFQWANSGFPLEGRYGPVAKVKPRNWLWGRLLKSRYRG